MDTLKNNISLYVPHELRTPLVSILGYSEILKDEFDSLSHVEILEMLTAINQSGQRLLERIEKFILYSEIITKDEDTVLGYSNDEFYISNGEIKNLLESCLRDELINNKLTIDMQDGLVKGVKRYFDFAIREIVQNASKFSEKDSEILLTGKLDSNEYIIKLVDHGHGMSQDQINEISAFQQFDRKKYQQIGNGLGLAIISRIAELFNNKFKIESHCYTCTVPVLNKYGEFRYAICIF